MLDTLRKCRRQAAEVRKIARGIYDDKERRAVLAFVDLAMSPPNKPRQGVPVRKRSS